MKKLKLWNKLAEHGCVPQAYINKIASYKT